MTPSPHPATASSPTPATNQPPRAEHAPGTPDAKTNPNAPAADGASGADVAPAAKGPDWWLMMRAFLTQGKRIASFAPSSKSMARKLLAGIDWDKTESLVELGGGTGPITVEMARLARPTTRLVVIELDPTLCSRL
ncbi:MAG: hypothetical protein K2V38_19395, partial [Gemmataceae bacterium]|nr:hypothetical protein [Gemmataceae bacterium]